MRGFVIGLRGIRPLWATILLALWAACAQAADAPAPELLEKVRRANAECLACHSEAGVKNPPRPGMDLARLRQTVVDPEIFKGADHGNMECRQCHSQVYNAYPHPENAQENLSPCEECHAARVMKIERQFDKSVHAKNLKEKMTCTTCHNVHEMTVAAKLGDPHKIVAQDNKICLDCHDSDLTFSKFAPEESDPRLGSGKKRRPAIDDIHEWLPNTRLHWQAVRCVECHTPADKIQSHQVLDKEKAERKCATCHSASSSLNTRLYRHLAKEEQNRYGFLNSIILSNTYVLGATRHPVLDAVLIGAFGLTVAGVLGHGALRILMAFLRRRKNHE